MSEITKSSVLNIIKQIRNPDLDTNHLGLNSIKTFVIEKDVLNLDISIHRKMKT